MDAVPCGTSVSRVDPEEVCVETSTVYSETSKDGEH